MEPTSKHLQLNLPTLLHVNRRRGIRTSTTTHIDWNPSQGLGNKTKKKGANHFCFPCIRRSSGVETLKKWKKKMRAMVVVVVFCQEMKRKKIRNRVLTIFFAWVLFVDRSRAGGRSSIQFRETSVSDVVLDSGDRRSHRPCLDDPPEKYLRRVIFNQEISITPPFSHRLQFHQCV